MSCWIGALLALALLPLPSLAQPAATPPVDRLKVTGEHNRLGNGYRDWNELTVGYSRQWDRRELAEIALSRTHRFGASDTQVEAGYTRPFGPQLTLSAQVAFSPTSRVLPRHGAELGAQYEFMPAWLAHARLRHTVYRTTSVDQATLMLERYFANYSASLAWRTVRALGTQANGIELRGNAYYGDDSYVGLIASAGDEATPTAPAIVKLADVRAMALVGRHRLQPGWSAIYALNRTRQGSFYTRTGFSVGVQHDF